MNVIVSPMVEQVPQGPLPPPVLARGAAVLLGQFDADPCWHHFGVTDVPLEHLACRGDAPVCLVDLRERIFLLLLETNTFLLHAGLAAPRIVQLPLRPLDGGLSRLHFT